MLAVFIEPSELFKENIIYWKKLVQSLLPNQPYTQHPPHCTLICTEVIDEDQAQSRVSASLKDLRPFSVKIEGPYAFWHDSATCGGHIQSVGNWNLSINSSNFKNWWLKQLDLF